MQVAFVVQRYGPEVNGGAELLCRWVAEHLTPYGDIHVLTTCAQDYTRWENVYPAGEETLNGVYVHRFPVDYPRNLRLFQRYSRTLFMERHTYLDELEWMRQQGPVSTALLDYIEQQRDAFDVFIFVTYLYATSYFGLSLVPQKAILVPAAHDEPMLYLPMFRPLFNIPRYIIFNTHAEQRLVHRVFGNRHIPSSVVGTGINVPDDVSGERFRRKYGLADPFVLYIGRIDKSKNVPELLDYFSRVQAEQMPDLKLVLIGRGPAQVPPHPAIVPLGFVSEADKFDALQAARVLIAPSRYESLSMTVLESWLMKKPVLVNGRCDVLREQCLRSNGGLYYRNYDEFALALYTILASPELQKQLGRQGQAYAAANYRWSVIEKGYLQAIARLLMNTGDLFDQEPLLC